ncbi:F-box protein At5g06550-like [Actinia tenebrosa]|uniref:F-box protein At5g06550-like n=1 Tax=Actinia tenebrosa TaxID=6105 RepID=A0A6P8IEU9_ACTTE|nr:F-box protein At5g06550-like [Actinia tenebrosa]
MRSVKLLFIISSFALYLNLSVGKEAKNLPKGHGAELGKHRESDGHVDVLTTIPSPQDFWDKYASIQKPVVFQGAAKNFPAQSLWTDSYLKKNYGDLEVKLEAKKEKDHVPVGDRGVGRDTIKSFLNSYVQKDSYMVTQLPDPLAKEVRILPCLMCGTFSERILEANLWLSSGGTKSMLHKDADNAINCLLNGTKNWILIHPENEENIPVAEGDKGYGGFAVLDVDQVNLLKYPNFTKVHWQYANMTAGDCLYLPYSYWHQVRSYGSKNMAVSVLFSRLTKFNSTGCKTAKLEYTPLSDINMVWTYPGHGPQTMGNLDPFEVKDSYLAALNEKNDGRITVDDLFEQYSEAKLYEDHPVIRKEIAQKVLNILDPDNKGFVTKDDVEALTVEKLKAVANVVDPDAANTEEYEHVIFGADEVRNAFEEGLEEGDGVLTLQKLIVKYQSLGGSEKVARELFAMLKPKNEEYATTEEVKKNLSDVLELYKKIRDDDKSGVFYEQHYREDKEIMTETLKENENIESKEPREEL